ncbi:NAD(P)H-binding protein [Lapidilactobacillus wuchangensis]|uniref:NAD(P)H-binding protein n=1 Tax=Lapidilactobacillus wuchangensis TaxID=2486001 RepID=UPI000F7B7563|nr:NAD(P)H-binding protein [Lapidilactobacillus wuchangensis]
MKYLVTGATGHLGRDVVRDLIAQVGAAQVVAGVHTPAKAEFLRKQGVELAAIDYLNVATMTTALQGVDVLVYIPSKTYDIVQRVTELENTLTAMKKAQVSQIVFVSFYADQENNPFVMSPYYGYAPRRLAASGLQFAVLKNALYADPLVPYLPELIQRHALIYPVGDQAMSFITQQDSALAIATVAAHQSLRDQGQVYTLTQQQAWQMPALGQLMSKVTGQQIGYQPVSVTEFGQIYAAEGDGQELASMYQAGAMGLLDQVTTDFEQITGQAPESMADFLTKSVHNATTK